MSFEIINTLKKEKGITNAQLAEKAGITLSTIDKLTSGINTNPTLDTLIAICDVLGCTLNDFSNKKYEDRKSPSSGNGELRENEIEMFNYLRNGLINLGYIRDGQDITASQAQVISSVCRILDASFNNK